jgi:hypothetical protein
MGQRGQSGNDTAAEPSPLAPSSRVNDDSKDLAENPGPHFIV